MTVPPAAQAGGVLAFDPVPLRYRSDGLTPDKQREYVEALADCGVARQAAARIGVTEQAIARVRRRADARGFDLACEAAQRIGARRIRSVAYERAIEGTVKRHYYHGELKSEEVVFDNRLLVYLLGKTAHLVEPPAETQAVVDNWEKWMEAIGQGLPAPAPPPPADAGPEGSEEEDSEQGFWVGEEDVWEEDDGSGWWTRFPPPAGFDGLESGPWGEEDYRRTLTEDEVEAVEAARDEELLERLGPEIARRDWYFGFEGGSDEADDLAGDDEADVEADEEQEPAAGAGGKSPLGPEALPPGAKGQAEVRSSGEAETCETSETSGASADQEAGGARAGESDGAPPDPPRGEPRIRSL